MLNESLGHESGLDTHSSEKKTASRGNPGAESFSKLHSVNYAKATLEPPQGFRPIGG